MEDLEIYGRLVPRPQKTSRFSWQRILKDTAKILATCVEVLQRSRQSGSVLQIHWNKDRRTPNPVGTFSHFETVNLPRELERLLGLARSPGGEDAGIVHASDWVPPVDIQEDEKGFAILVDVPGGVAGNVDVTMDKGVLTIRGVSQIEIWFGILSKKVIKRGAFCSEGQLKEKLFAFIAHFNETLAKPFR